MDSIGNLTSALAREISRLVAVSEALNALSIRRSKQWEFLLQERGMLDRGHRYGDLLSISENCNWYILLGG